MAEMQQQALLPLQKAMQQMTSEQESNHCEESSDEMQLAAMRVLANVSWVLEMLDKTSLQQRQPTVSNIHSDTASCKT